jgi:hypothetical protein
LGVFADEREVSKLMIESSLVKTGDIGVASFVVRMTVGAGRVLRARFLAMKAGLVRNIIRNLFVAIETQIALLRLLELHVATVAIFFVLGMRFDHFAGHDERLDLGEGRF